MPFDFEVVPGVRIGPFSLGAPVGAVIAFLKQFYTIFTEVQLSYSRTAPRSTPISIQLPQCGTKLVFDPTTQQLEAVHIYNPAAVSLSHNKVVFNKGGGGEGDAVSDRSAAAAAAAAADGEGGGGGRGRGREGRGGKRRAGGGSGDGAGSESPAAMIFAQKHFGPTRPPRYDAVGFEFLLEYPGLSASFPVAEEQRHYFDGSNAYNGGGATFDPTSTLACPDGTVQVMGSLSVHRGNSAGGGVAFARAGAASTGATPGWASAATQGGGAGKAAPTDAAPAFYGEKVVVTEGVGLEFTGRGAWMKFGDTPQDVVSDFGPPSKVYYKQEDKMQIHQPAAAPQRKAAATADYFYNYFALGVDVLFNGQTHTSAKYVLHANQPGHYDFDRYYRCNFSVTLPLPPGAAAAAAAAAAGAHTAGAASGRGGQGSLDGSSARLPKSAASSWVGSPLVPSASYEASAAQQPAAAAAATDTTAAIRAGTGAAAAAVLGDAAPEPLGESKSARKKRKKKEKANAAAALLLQKGDQLHQHQQLSDTGAETAEDEASPAISPAGSPEPPFGNATALLEPVVGDAVSLAASSGEFDDVDLGSSLSLGDGDDGSGGGSLGGSGGGGRGGGANAAGKYQDCDSVEVTPCCEWAQLEEMLGSGSTQALGQPVAFNREPAANCTNPYGATALMGTDACVFEIMPNSHVATVTIFKP